MSSKTVTDLWDSETRIEAYIAWKDFSKHQLYALGLIEISLSDISCWLTTDAIFQNTGLTHGWEDGSLLFKYTIF